MILSGIEIEFKAILRNEDEEGAEMYSGGGLGLTVRHQANNDHYKVLFHRKKYRVDVYKVYNSGLTCARLGRVSYSTKDEVYKLNEDFEVIFKFIGDEFTVIKNGVEILTGTDD